jgi:hypothetical protein
MGVKVHWAEGLPGPREPIASIVRVPKRGSIVVGLTSSRPTGVWTHYFESTEEGQGRTLPCLGPDCRHVRCVSYARWYGYCSCVGAAVHGRTILEITEAAARGLLDLVGNARDCRGLIVELGRESTRKGAPVRVKKSARTWKGEVPLGFDPVPTLLHVWGLDRRAGQRVPVWDDPWDLSDPADDTQLRCRRCGGQLLPGCVCPRCVALSSNGKGEGGAYEN